MSSKSAKRRARRAQAQQARSRRRLLGWLVVFALAAIAALYLAPRWRASSEQITFPHIHGLAFSADGEALIVPAHDGFRVYSQGEWSIPENVPRRDYMGYSAVADGFYSSGHPEPGSSEVNPLGLIKSEDLGQSISVLGFEGESDFHTMAASYYSEAIYVLNPAPNSQLAPGLHYSLDGGESWQPAAANGLAAAPIQIAVHPTDPEQIAAATEQGLYFSEDHGNNFQLIGAPAPVTSVSFLLDGSGLLVGGLELRRFDFQSQDFSLLSTPALADGEWLLFLAQNPADATLLAAATSDVNIFLSEDSGESWQQIVEAGRGKN